VLAEQGVINGQFLPFMEQVDNSGKLVTNSLMVAVKFHKQYKNVLLLILKKDAGIR